MRDKTPTVRSRELGAALKRVRVRSGYNSSALARKLGWSPSRVSRLESGKRGTSEAHVAVLLGTCGVKGDELEEVLALCRETYSRTWLQSHAGQPHDIVSALINEEASAARIVEYEPLVMPSLLQTADYAHALFARTGLIPDDEIDLWVQKRMERQAVFRQRQPPAFLFYVSEQVLRWPVADMYVMNDQLQHMALISSLPHCTIRVVPTDVGNLLAEPFRLMEYFEYQPVAYVRSLTTSLFLEEPEDIRAYQAVVARLEEGALDPRQSRDLLQGLAHEYDIPRSASEHAENDQVNNRESRDL